MFKNHIDSSSYVSIFIQIIDGFVDKSKRVINLLAYTTMV